MYVIPELRKEKRRTLLELKNEIIGTKQLAKGADSDS